MTFAAGACFAGIKMPVIEEDTGTDEPATDTGEIDEEGSEDWLIDGPCPFMQIPFQAEDMERNEGFVQRTTSLPGIGDFIIDPDGRSGIASVELDIPCEDDWTLWGLVWWESDDHDSFYWAWDNPDNRYVWNVMQQCNSSIEEDWYWDQVSRSPDISNCRVIHEDPAVVHLIEGSRTFYLEGRESNTPVAEFVLTNDPDWSPE